MKPLSFSLIGLSLLVPALGFAAGPMPFAPNPFTDVPAKHANFEAIEYLRENNVLRGYLDGTFKPDNRISRAEFVKLITSPFILDTADLSSCMQKLYPDESVSVFPDVPRDAWYAAELCHARSKRIIDGYPNGTFGPNAYINVAEGAKILANVFRFEIAKEDQGERWFVPYVKHLAGLHAIPSSATSLSQPMTRGEMAEILYRLKADRTDKASVTFENMKN